MVSLRQARISGRTTSSHPFLPAALSPPKCGSFSASHRISGVQFISDSTPFLYPSVHSVVTPESSQCFNSRHALSGMPPLRIVHCVSLRAFYFSLQSHLEGVGGGRGIEGGRTRLGAIKALI